MQDTGDAKEKAREAAGEAQEKAQSAAQQAKGRISEQVDERSTQAGQQVHVVARDVRSVAEQLRSQGKDKPAQYAEQAADRVHSAGQWLEQKNGDELLRDVEDFARRNPWAVAAGGLVLGLVASRMLKASSSERYRASSSNGETRSLESEPMPSGAATGAARFERTEKPVGGFGDFGGGSEPGRQEGSMISTEPRS